VEIMNNAPDRDIQKLRKLFGDRGLKLTHQRLEVYAVLAASKDHPSAETVWERVRERAPTVSLDTVYRALGTFERHGLAQRIPIEGDQWRYDGDVSRHHHMVCLTCRSIVDFAWPEFDAGGLPPEVEAWGRVDDAQVIVRGECAQCAASGGVSGG